jgi:prepilin-type N-terminal cleavage/methylation domain-containing protein
LWNSSYSQREPAKRTIGAVRAGERGYSLLELLVVLAILGLIIAIAAPRVIVYFENGEIGDAGKQHPEAFKP